jgi:putative redox protein
MDAKVIWSNGLAFSGTADSGFTLPIDSHNESIGGEGKGFSPLELVAIGLAGCTALDVISILRKKQQQVTGFEVRVHAEQAREHPHVFTEVQVVYVVTGRNIGPAAVERAIELSVTKYCPVQAMLSKAASITHTYQIIEAEPTIEAQREAQSKTSR